MAIGLGLSLVLVKLPFMGLLFHPLVTIVHELGHSVAGWIFGYPSIPAFDFSEGGGVTFHFREDPDRLGNWIMFGIILVLLWRTRRHRPTTIGLLGFGAIYGYLAFTHWHEAIILAAGEGAVLIMASVFLNRAMTGTALLQADERPAYAMVGFILLFNEVSFFWRLANDASFRDFYDEGKSYADNDLVRLMTEQRIHTSLPAMGNYGLGICVAMVILARLAYAYEGEITRWWSLAFGDGD